MDTNPIFIGAGEQPVTLPLRVANRHGLVAGATGTGKTITVQCPRGGFFRSRCSRVRGRRQGRSGRSGPPRHAERADCRSLAEDRCRAAAVHCLPGHDLGRLRRGGNAVAAQRLGAGSADARAHAGAERYPGVDAGADVPLCRRRRVAAARHGRPRIGPRLPVCERRPAWGRVHRTVASVDRGNPASRDVAAKRRWQRISSANRHCSSRTSYVQASTAGGS
jgi:hypothetical protein